VPAEGALLHSLGMRFFLSSGPGHGHVTEAATVQFAGLLRARHLPYRLELLVGKHHAWERQLVDGLRWAFGSGG
jgi:hypothetical protein